MLKSFKLRAKEFNRILESFNCYTEYSKNLGDYLGGYKDKQKIYYNETELICTESHLKYLNLLEEDDLEIYSCWKQVAIRLDEESTVNRVKKDVNGTTAWCRVHKNLQRYYKKDEIKNILSSYSTEYNKDLIQQHYIPTVSGLNLYKNCSYLDINGAHNYLLTKIFPKAAEYFKMLYKDRKIHEDNKKIVNFFVGMLNTKDKDGKFNRYPLCYNYIVQSVTNIITPAVLDALGESGELIYENTDGFIVKDAEKLPEISTELGGWKLESSGDIYTYVDKNYWCLQYRDKEGKKILKGNLLNSVRELVDLEEGRVVHYDKTQNEFKQFVAVNVKTEIIKEVKIHD